MLSAQSAISATRRGITFGAFVRMLLASATLAVAIAGPMMWPRWQTTGALVLIAIVWIALSVRSAKAARLTHIFPFLVARKEFEEAESLIETALRSFSLFRPAKLMALHQLAVLRNAQDRHADAAAICRELLTHRLGELNTLSRSARLILAQSSLETADLPTAAEALAGLSVEKLNIGESMNLVALQLDYQSRIGLWGHMFDRYMSKVQLAEVMPANLSALSQALLALTAGKSGRDDVAKWLASRAALLTDVKELAKQRPILGELFNEPRA